MSDPEAVLREIRRLYGQLRALPYYERPETKGNLRYASRRYLELEQQIHDLSLQYRAMTEPLRTPQSNHFDQTDCDDEIADAVDAQQEHDAQIVEQALVDSGDHKKARLAVSEDAEQLADAIRRPTAETANACTRPGCGRSVTEHADGGACGDYVAPK